MRIVFLFLRFDYSIKKIVLSLPKNIHKSYNFCFCINILSVELNAVKNFSNVHAIMWIYSHFYSFKIWFCVSSLQACSFCLNHIRNRFKWDYLEFQLISAYFGTLAVKKTHKIVLTYYINICWWVNVHRISYNQCFIHALNKFMHSVSHSLEIFYFHQPKT